MKSRKWVKERMQRAKDGKECMQAMNLQELERYKIAKIFGNKKENESSIHNKAKFEIVN